MTSWISMPVIPPGVPVVRSTRVSAMSWPAGPGVPAGAEGVGVPGQGGVDGDAAGDGEQGGEVAHGVRGRAEADVPFGGGVAGALGDGARVPPVGGGPGRGDDAPVPGAVEGSGVGGEFVVDGGPVRRGEAGGFLHEQGGAPFVELPGLQRREGVGHFGDEGFGQAQEPSALGRGFAPGQGDLRADPGSRARPAGIPGVGLFAALDQVEGDGQAGLTGSQGRLLVLQGPDLSNQARTVQIRHDPAQWHGCIFGDRHTNRRFQNHVGPLLAVHGIRLPGTCDIKEAPEPAYP